MYRIFNTKLPNEYFTADNMEDANAIATHFIIEYTSSDKDERVFIFKSYNCIYEYQGTQRVMLKSKNPQSHYDKTWYCYKQIEKYKALIRRLNNKNI